MSPGIDGGLGWTGATRSKHGAVNHSATPARHVETVFVCFIFDIFTAFFELVSGNVEVTEEVSIDGPAWMNAGFIVVTSGGVLNFNAETFRGNSFRSETDGTYSYLASGKIFF